MLSVDSQQYVVARWSALQPFGPHGSEASLNTRYNGIQPTMKLDRGGDLGPMRPVSGGKLMGPLLIVHYRLAHSASAKPMRYTQRRIMGPLEMTQSGPAVAYAPLRPTWWTT